MKKMLRVNVAITEREQAEEALRRAVQFDEAVMLNMSEGLYTVDTQGLVTFMNPSAERSLGWRLDELRGRKMHDLIHHTHRDGTPFLAADCAGLRVLREGKVLTDHEDVFIRKDGTFFDVSYSASTLREGDDITGLVVVFRDITDRKYAEEALRASEERWQLAVTGSTDGMWDWDIQRQKVFLSSRWKELRGYGEEEIGTDETEWSSRIHPDDFHMVMSTVKSYLEKKTPAYACEYRAACKNGTFLWIIDRGMAVWDKQGIAIRMIGSETDMTDRKRAQDALRESEGRFRRMADTAPVLIWLSDTNKLCTWFNKPWLNFTGRTMQQELGNGWADGVHQDDFDQCLTNYTTAFERRHPFTMEYRLRRYDGEYRWILDNGIPCFSEEATFTGYIGSCIDITERKRAEDAQRENEQRLQFQSIQLEQLVEERTAELQQSQVRLRALATDLTLTEQRERKRLATELHDHLAQLLALSHLKLGQAKQVAGGAPQCVNLIAQTEDILSRSLTYTRTLVADLCPPVLHEFGLQAALRWLGEQMRRENILVAMDLCEDDDLKLPEDWAVLLFESVRELLRNAAKHAATDAAFVRLYCATGALHIKIRDEGAGFTLESTGAHDAPGFASQKFGLFSIRERMKALGGTFDIQSNPGLGTTATITVPLTDGRRTISVTDSSIVSQIMAPTADFPTPRGSPSGHASARLRVLLVDDHAMVRQGLRSVLETYVDIEVIGEASDGEEAVVKAEQFQPSVIVMDINMPKMNGIKATAQIKARFPSTVIIGLSVNADEGAQKAM
ncbi:MAG TPA: PAS domain S-box protein, partial [Nitrospiraceae bacterium]|nr:PAS domain S-box protein [Nitrospiraceae bacterium]